MQSDYARHAGLGFEFAATVGGLAWLGWILDGRLGLQTIFPAFLLVGTFVGLGLGIYRLMLKTGQAGKRDNEEDEE